MRRPARPPERPRARPRPFTESSEPGVVVARREVDTGGWRGPVGGPPPGYSPPPGARQRSKGSEEFFSASRGRAYRDGGSGARAGNGSRDGSGPPPIKRLGSDDWVARGGIGARLRRLFTRRRRG